MSVEIIRQKILSYNPRTTIEEDNAHKEIAQEIALLALSRANFFRVAAFQGGTALRILYGLQRFSEDLDFVLLKPDKSFDWESYLKGMIDVFNNYGYTLTVTKKSKLGSIKSEFLKIDSIGGILNLNDKKTNKTILKIKLEIDTNPPSGSKYEFNYLDFPLSFSVRTQDLPSLFASKSHALLCRPYVKGRDWFDFIWYVSRKTKVNFELLTSAIDQFGHWKDKKIQVDAKWYIRELRDKIHRINWDEAKKDVVRFLNAQEQISLDVWSEDFFLSRVKILENYL